MDDEYTNNKGILLSGRDLAQGASSSGYDLKNEFSAQKEIVSKNVSNAGIKNNVSDGINKIILNNAQKVDGDSDSINTQRSIIENQKENIDAQHKKVSQEQNRRYNEEKESVKISV